MKKVFVIVDKNQWNTMSGCSSYIFHSEMHTCLQLSAYMDHLPYLLNKVGQISYFRCFQEFVHSVLVTLVLTISIQGIIIVGEMTDPL